MALLEINDLSIDYVMPSRRIHAVDHVSLVLEQGESLGLVGESGSGKSTLGMAVLQLLAKDTAKVTGSVRFDGEELLTMKPDRLHQVRWQSLAAVFQKSMNSLSPVHRIGNQMADVYHTHHTRLSKKECRDRVMEALKQVNLAERVYKLYPHELSGGMMQRVSIALSLLNNPKMIIFDEATTALDVITQGQILKEIQRLEKELGLTRMMITHDISVVATSCTHVAVLYAGRLMEVGPTKDVLTKPAHPYTQGLLSAFPSLYGTHKQLKGIPGTLPDLSLDIPGCVFAPRCPYATDMCRKENPVLKAVEGGRQAACHYLLTLNNGAVKSAQGGAASND